MNVPAFRRSLWGYSVKEVDRYLQKIADERQRLETSLTRVETMLAEWQCGPEPILAAAHREAAEIRAAARRETAYSAPAIPEPRAVPESRGSQDSRSIDGRGILEPRIAPEPPRIPDVRSATEMRSVPELRPLSELRTALELRTAAEVRTPDVRSAPRDLRSAAKADTKVQMISLNGQHRDFGAQGDPNAPTPRFASFRSDDPSAAVPSDFMPERALTESDLNAIEALERSRANRQRRTRRMLALVGSGVSVLAAIAFAFSDPAPKLASGAGPKTGSTVPRAGAAAGKQPGKPSGGGDATSKAAAQASGTPTPQTLMLTISAVKPCWIRTVVDGGQQMERVLQANDTVMLHATNEVLLRVGDASALSLLINNRPIKPLGRRGEVVTQLITRTNYASLLQPES